MTDYWFRPQPVVDPEAGGILVPTATFQVFAASDTDFTTPLTVYTMVAGALTAVTTLTTNGASIVDEFRVTDQWEVWLKSGTHAVLAQSVQGLAEAAEAARAAAVIAQAAAEAVAAAGGATGLTAEQIDLYLGGPAGNLVNKVVTLTGDQAVDGIKTFTDPPVVPDGSFATSKIQAPGTRDDTTYLRGDGTFTVPPGSSTLATAVAGARFTCLWNAGTGKWRYMPGVDLNARPSSRTDIYFDYNEAPVGTPFPTYAIRGDKMGNV